jgi:hypothetical protein
MDVDRDGYFILPVKQNLSTLFDALDALPWRDVPIAHSRTEAGHGRITTRRSRAPLPERWFPDREHDPQLAGGGWCGRGYRSPLRLSQLDK